MVAILIAPQRAAYTLALPRECDCSGTTTPGTQPPLAFRQSIVGGAVVQIGVAFETAFYAAPSVVSANLSGSRMRSVTSDQDSTGGALNRPPRNARSIARTMELRSPGEYPNRPSCAPTAASGQIAGNSRAAYCISFMEVSQRYSSTRSPT